MSNIILILLLTIVMVGLCGLLFHIIYYDNGTEAIAVARMRLDQHGLVIGKCYRVKYNSRPVEFNVRIVGVTNSTPAAPLLTLCVALADGTIGCVSITIDTIDVYMRECEVTETGEWMFDDTRLYKNIKK